MRKSPHTSSPPSSRPLSPHLQIYTIQITSLLSILHRITGIFLFFGAFVWCAYLPTWPFRALQPYCHEPWFCWTCGVFLGFFLLSLFYHLLSGIRHLFWDWGRGGPMDQVHQSAWIVLIGTVLLTGGTLWFLL